MSENCHAVLMDFRERLHDWWACDRNGSLEQAYAWQPQHLIRALHLLACMQGTSPLTNFLHT